MIPTNITLHKKSRTLELGYADNSFILPAPYLRAKSPSAETKKNPPPYNPQVGIQEAKPIGNYALQIYFDDNHKTGIYTWEYLRQLCIEMKNEQIRRARAPAEKAQPLHIRPAKSK